MINLLSKIKKAKLVGRGGAEFSTSIKWELTAKTKKDPKYVICNASEGEMGVFKDFYILKNHAEDVIKGMILAMDFLNTKESYFNFNTEYYKKLKSKLTPILKKYEKKGYKFTIYLEDPSYIGGEETALLNAIEEKRIEPRSKPPFPGESGLFSKPTLIHNVETLFNVAQVDEDKFESKRFYCISEKTKPIGVYHLSDNLTIYQILEQTKNLPKSDFFVQIGGGASGLVLNQKQTKKQKMTGAGSLQIFPIATDPKKMLLTWFKFYNDESCGKCTPCREGTYQLYEMVKKNKNIPWKKIMDIIEVMETTSFCALGRSIGIPVKSYMKNVLKIS